MDIFESLENLNVSEACFEDIVGIVEEYIHEILVGKNLRGEDNAEKGAGAEDMGPNTMRRELKKHFAPKLRGQAKHDAKMNKKREKESKELRKEFDQANQADDKAFQKWKSQQDKTTQSFDNYKEVQNALPDSPAADALWQEYRNNQDKASKLSKAHDRASDKLRSVSDQRTEMSNQAWRAHDRQKKINRLGYGPSAGKRKSAHKISDNLYKD